jgi:hypothetical protein
MLVTCNSGSIPYFDREPLPNSELQTRGMDSNGYDYQFDCPIMNVRTVQIHKLEIPLTIKACSRFPDPQDGPMAPMVYVIDGNNNEQYRELPTACNWSPDDWANTLGSTLDEMDPAGKWQCQWDNNYSTFVMIHNSSDTNSLLEWTKMDLLSEIFGHTHDEVYDHNLGVVRWRSDTSPRVRLGRDTLFVKIEGLGNQQIENIQTPSENGIYDEVITIPYNGLDPYQGYGIYSWEPTFPVVYAFDVPITISHIKVTFLVQIRTKFYSMWMWNGPIIAQFIVNTQDTIQENKDRQTYY